MSVGKNLYSASYRMGRHHTGRQTVNAHLVDEDFEPDHHFDRAIQRCNTQLNQMNMET
jgi:hypothetical protein